jgi:Mn2+/Fe2+ NRAMP family transporter
MGKKSVRLVLVLAALMVAAFASSISAGEVCTMDNTYTDANGNPLICFHCRTVTYCYPA